RKGLDRSDRDDVRISQPRLGSKLREIHSERRDANARDVRSMPSGHLRHTLAGRTNPIRIPKVGPQELFFPRGLLRENVHVGSPDRKHLRVIPAQPPQGAITAGVMYIQQIGLYPPK